MIGYSDNVLFGFTIICGIYFD